MGARMYGHALRLRRAALLASGAPTTARYGNGVQPLAAHAYRVARVRTCARALAMAHACRAVHAQWRACTLAYLRNLPTWRRCGGWYGMRGHYAAVYRPALPALPYAVACSRAAYRVAFWLPMLLRLHTGARVPQGVNWYARLRTPVQRLTGRMGRNWPPRRGACV